MMRRGLFELLGMQARPSLQLSCCAAAHLILITSVPATNQS